MLLLADIFVVVTLPIIAMIAIGYWVQGRMPESRKVLTFVYANITLPAFMVHFISTTTLPLSAMWPVVGATAAHAALAIGFGWLAARALGFGRDAVPVVAMGGSFGNIGNFGIPVVVLAFPPDYAVQQAIIAATSAMIFVPLCSLMLAPRAEDRTWGGAIAGVLANPIVIGVVIGVLLKAGGVVLPLALAKPLQMLAAAYIAIALLGLGAALHGGSLQLSAPMLRTALVLKLFISPLLAGLSAWVLGFSGTMLAVLVIAGSLPTAALVGVLAAHNPKLRESAASIVFVSTVIAPFVVTLWIFAMRWLSP